MHGNAPGAFRGTGCQQEELLDHCRFGNGPFHGLVAAHAAAHEQVDLFNAQMPAQQDMRLHHIANGNERELVIERFAGSRIDAQRPRGAVAGADDIGANDKIFLRIDHFTRANNAFPPVGSIGIGCEGMADPYHFAVRAQGSIGMVGNGQLWKLLSGFQRKRLVKVKSLHSVNTDSGCKVNACMNYICKNLYHDKN